MDGVAIRAHHVLLRVSAAPDVRSRDRLSVTTQAGVQGLFGAEFGKGNNRGLAAASFNMRLSRSVAALTTGVLRSLCTRCKALEVRVFVEIRPDVRMAGFADVAADVVRRKRPRWRQKTTGHQCPKQKHVHRISRGKKQGLFKRSLYAAPQQRIKPLTILLLWSSQRPIRNRFVKDLFTILLRRLTKKKPEGSC